ncbi:OLC1v1021917C1 [Oldenlandia corymbosa var. corymbosa]|uniref:OLC1v1021917C1 n=1 Tax=Oldenlandia corymbosa var. corymbosa TaxID=529605 RepID=A0AAV1CAZ6_OLDCO|nr:OLC1v1021917C1 [Oldenlandia corymbosa var. corymbosa]
MECTREMCVRAAIGIDARKAFSAHRDPIIINYEVRRQTMEAVQSWVSEHKLTSIGSLWASAMGVSLAYSSRARSTPFKPSIRLIHARMHAQALTLAVLSGAAAYHYYEKQQNCNQAENAIVAN